MLRRDNFVAMVENQIEAGFARGLQVFTEEINADMSKNAVLHEHSLGDVVDFLVNDYAVRQQYAAR